MIVRMAKFNVEDKITLAMEGEVIFQDAKVESSKVDNAITYAKALDSCLELEVKIVNVQLQEMQMLGGVSFWPIPILHLCMSISIKLISLNPCGYCNKGYQCHDIAITSCKHTFHPFYLAQLFKSSNRCLVCNSILHPN